MEAKEFRLGNYAKDQFDQLITVSAIDYKDCLDNEIGDIPVYVLQPIPLTEEWLLKFGFSCSFISDPQERGATKGYFKEEIRIIQINEDIEEFIIGGHDFPIKDLKYVHQIQNIYFSLTGQELDYDSKL